jgi:hypothetical protein
MCTVVFCLVAEKNKKKTKKKNENLRVEVNEISYIFIFFYFFLSVWLPINNRKIKREMLLHH